MLAREHANDSSLCWESKDGTGAVLFDECLLSSTPWHCPMPLLPPTSPFLQISLPTEAATPPLTKPKPLCLGVMRSFATAWALGCVNSIVCYGDEQTE